MSEPVQADLERLRVGDRDIFIQVMKEFLDNRPSPERLREWGAKYPDRYVYAMKLMAGMMGLAEKVEYSGTILHAIANLSDVELMAKLQDLTVEVSHPMKNITHGKS